MKIFLTVMVFLTFLGCASSGVDRSDVSTEIEIQYAIVTNVEMVKIKSDVGKKAAIGGIWGLAIGAFAGGDVGSAVAGAAAGSALTAIATKIDEGSSEAASYTLKRRDGSEIKVITEDKHLENGDCVAVETGSTTNLRHVSQEMCTPPLDHIVENELAAEHQEDAGVCHEAKMELLNAETDEDLTAATKKVRVLCQH